MKLPEFAKSPSLTLGVELELQIVDLHRHDLIPMASDLLDQLRWHDQPGEIKPEMTRSMIEIATGVCLDHAQVLAQLQVLREQLLGAAHRIGVGLCGGGTHPFQDWSQRQITDAPRYHHLSHLYGYLAKQFTVFGQHVHVGVEDADRALWLLHGLSRFVPHLVAMSASSPFVRGVDTRFHSARLNMLAAFPLSGRAPFMLDWQHFRTYFAKMARTGIVHGMKDFYWDIRPKPESGTLEVRVMDTPLTLTKAAALAGFIQCLACWLLEERPFQPSEDDYLPYSFNRFQASRFGLQATWVDPADHMTKPLRESLLDLFDILAPYARHLRAEEALAWLYHEVLDGDGDAAWIRRTLHQDGNLSTLVARQAERWLQN